MYFIKGNYMKFKYLALIMIIINMFYINPYAENLKQDEIIQKGNLFLCHFELKMNA